MSWPRHWAARAWTAIREVGDTRGMAWALCWLGYTTWTLSDYATARAQLKEALMLFCQAGDQHGSAHTLIGLTKVATDQGAYPSAIERAEEALALFGTLGDKQGMLIALVRLARACYFSRADPARTLSLAEEAFALSRAVGFKLFTAYALSLLGLLALQRGEETLAHSHLEEALRLQTELWHQHGIAWAMYDLAGLRLAQRDYPKARTAYEEGLQRSMAVSDQMLVASCLEGLAAAMVAQGAEEGAVPLALWAARLWGAAAHVREAIGAPMPPVYRTTYEHALAQAQRQVHEQAFRTAWDEGRSMTPEQALATRPAEGSPSVQATPPSPTAASSNHPVRHPEGLTPRELEVLRLLAVGLTNPQIAERLVVSLPTINTHVAALFNKLGVNSRSAATRYAVEHHLV
jgi:ATP/maltotriose-dependent transcriptional regulator MalT